MADTDVDELVETFAFLTDWEERYQHVIELGRAAPPLDEADRRDDALVPGCASRVWLTPRWSDDAPPRLTIASDSDAFIVKGLAAILGSAYRGRTAKDAAQFDAEAFLARLSLEEHLSAQRANGLRSMVERIRAFAASADA